ncbi:MAG: hypothetical protein WD896_02235 [Parcubacteria group bacterium]
MSRYIIGSVLILTSILFLPYWVYVPVLFAGIVFFPFFWEGIFFSFLITALHGTGTGVLSLLTSPLTLAALVVLMILLPIKENLRNHV